LDRWTGCPSTIRYTLFSDCLTRRIRILKKDGAGEKAWKKGEDIYLCISIQNRIPKQNHVPKPFLPTNITEFKNQLDPEVTKVK
jgi:hypothetical protein